MSEQIFACIKGGIVENAIVADDAFVALIRSQYDDVIEVTDMSPRPGPGWTKNGNVYSPPQEEVESE